MTEDWQGIIKRRQATDAAAQQAARQEQENKLALQNQQITLEQAQIKQKAFSILDKYKVYEKLTSIRDMVWHCGTVSDIDSTPLWTRSFSPFKGFGYVLYLAYDVAEQATSDNGHYENTPYGSGYVSSITYHDWFYIKEDGGNSFVGVAARPYHNEEYQLELLSDPTISSRPSPHRLMSDVYPRFLSTREEHISGDMGIIIDTCPDVESELQYALALDCARRDKYPPAQLQREAEQYIEKLKRQMRIKDRNAEQNAEQKDNLISRVLRAIFD